MRDSGRHQGDAEVEGSDQPNHAWYPAGELANDSFDDLHDAKKVAADSDTRLPESSFDTSYDSSSPMLGVDEEMPPYVFVPIRRSPDLDQTAEPGHEASTDWNKVWEELSEALETVGNTPFTRDERREKVSPALLEAQETIRALVKITEQQSALINRLTEQLDRASEHLGRKDWIMMAIGAGTTLVIAGMVPAAVMVPTAVKFFQTIFGLSR